jgi:uncharacterized protein (TIGR02001 family)
MNGRRLGAMLGVMTWAIGGATAVSAQAPAPHPMPTTTDPAPTLSPPTGPESWKGPFGGTFTANFTFATDYSFRGISQTARQVAVQPSFGYDTPTIGHDDLVVGAYVGVWGSNFVSQGSSVEVDLLTGLRGTALNEKLSFDLGFFRYNYLGAPADLYYDFSEFGLVVGYDFGFVQMKAALYYSPNFYANSGEAWYKWGQIALPLRFIHVNENVAFRLFGSLGNQYVERYAKYEISADNYWDWQIGLAATVYGFDMTVAYVDTSLDVASCANTRNCEARIVFTLSKSF